MRLSQRDHLNDVVACHRLVGRGDSELIVFAGGGIVEERRFRQLFAQVIELFQRAFQGAIGSQLGVVAGLLGGVRGQTLLFRFA
ncbi:hypothetical protein D3C79_911980 [compost metagenome]